MMSIPMSHTHTRRKSYELSLRLASTHQDDRSSSPQTDTALFLLPGTKGSTSDICLWP